MFRKKRPIDEIIADVKNYYILTSMSNTGNENLKKGIQSIALCLLTLENNKNDQYIIRDTRNMIYDMQKSLNKEEKKLLKELLKIID